MDRIGPGAIVFVILLVILGLMYWGWRGRRARQSVLGLDEVPGAAELGAASLSVAGLYVSTTSAGAPLDRVTLPGLAFRGRVVVTVYPLGVLVAVTGEPEVFVPASRIRSVGTSTWTIDRVVEQGGMVRLDWTVDALQGSPSPSPSVDVESFFRIESTDDSSRLIDAITLIAPSSGASPDQEGTRP